jgi:hypothetical protein
MSKLNSLLIIFIALSFVGCSYLSNLTKKNSPSAPPVAKSPQPQHTQAASMAKEVQDLSAAVKKKEEDLLNLLNSQPQRTGLRGTKFHLDKASDAAEEIKIKNFDNKLLIWDIQNVREEVDTFLKEYPKDYPKTTKENAK